MVLQETLSSIDLTSAFGGKGEAAATAAHITSNIRTAYVASIASMISSTVPQMPGMAVETAANQVPLA